MIYELPPGTFHKEAYNKNNYPNYSIFLTTEKKVTGQLNKPDLWKVPPINVGIIKDKKNLHWYFSGILYTNVSSTAAIVMLYVSLFYLMQFDFIYPSVFICP